jgi:hypothetical protein
MVRGSPSAPVIPAKAEIHEGTAITREPVMLSALIRTRFQATGFRVFLKPEA